MIDRLVRERLVDLRRQVKLVPEIVVRELVANALIHQDLTVGGASVMVESASPT